MIQTNSDSEVASSSNGGGDQSLHTGLLILSDHTKSTSRYRWSKVYAFFLTLNAFLSKNHAADDGVSMPPPPPPPPPPLPDNDVIINFPETESKDLNAPRDSEVASSGNGGVDQSLHTGLLILSDHTKSTSPYRWSKVYAFFLTLNAFLSKNHAADDGVSMPPPPPPPLPDNDVIINFPETESKDLNTPRDSEVASSGNGGVDQSLHTGLLILSDHAKSTSCHAARSRWSKVHIIFAFFLKLRPPSRLYISVPHEVYPHNYRQPDINIHETTTEFVIPLAEELNTPRDCVFDDQFSVSVFNSNLNSGLGLVAGCQEAVKGSSAKSLAGYLIDETKSWNIMLLVLTGLLLMVTGILDYGARSGWQDSFFIFVFFLLLITVPSVTKFRQAKKLEKNRKKEKVGVIRDGGRQEIEAYAVVEWDIVILEKGIRVPGDGLLVDGTDDGLDFDQPLNKPFLHYGAKVICGTGCMIVTAVGSDTKVGELMRNVTCDLNAPTRLQSWILGPVICMETVSLCTSILVILVIFIRFRHKNHDKSLPEMKGKPPLEDLMRLFMRSLVRPRGLVSFLGTALSTLVMVYQQGVPLAITLALSYWNQKLESSLTNDDDHHHAHPQNLSACATMGFANVICFHISDEMVRQTMEEEAIRTIKTFTEKGVSIIIISEDKLDGVRSILGQHFSNFGTLEGETFRSLEDNVRNERIDYQIMVMEDFTAQDKLKLVQCLKQKGNVVAFYLGGDRRCDDAPALIEADVGLSDQNCNTEFLKEASDIIITRGTCIGRSLSSIYSLWKCCRCISNNLQKFTALQLIVCVSGLIINSVSNLVLGESTMTTIQVVWANMVICILGGSMMIIKLPKACKMKVASDGLLGSRTNPLTKGMWMNVVIQVIYQVFVLMFFLFEGHITRRLLGINQDVKNTFVFNSFILCQVVNVLNTMQLDKKKAFLVTMKCYIFLASLVSILVVQILLVQFASCLAKFSKLNSVQWVQCVIVALLPWVCRFILKSL